MTRPTIASVRRPRFQSAARSCGLAPSDCNSQPRRRSATSSPSASIIEKSVTTSSATDSGSWGWTNRPLP